jgi:hypothetical protein
MGVLDLHRCCRTCKEVKPILQFYKYNDKRYHPEARQTLCRKCYNARSLKSKDRTPETRAIRLARLRTYGQANRARITELSRIRARKLRELVVAKYGGACACCGESEQRFLTIDHVNNDGHAERLALANNSVRLTYKLHKMPRSDRYQLLCFNCNCGRALNKTICPHEEELRRRVSA